MTKEEEDFNSKLKHLEFIEATISRMNASSNAIKQWTCLIVSAFITCYCHYNDNRFFLFSACISLVMSYLDANYLLSERKYRKLYNDVAGITDKRQEMLPFDMSTQKYSSDSCTLWESYCSWSVSGFYLTVAFILVIVYFLLK